MAFEISILPIFKTKRHSARKHMKKKTQIKWGSSQETIHEEENSNKMASSFQFIPFAHETGMSQEIMHNIVRRAELVNPICVTQHPDNQANE